MSDPRAFILIIDDDDDMRQSLQEVLEEEGYGVYAARNGREARDLLHRIPTPNMVLLDLMMPVMSGWEFMQRVRESGELTRVPVVIISASRSPSLPPGALGLLRKPMD